jgi:hypothetical protein
MCSLLCKRNFVILYLFELFDFKKLVPWYTRRPSEYLPARLLQAPRMKRMWQYSSCVYSVIIQSQLSPAVHCVSWVHLTSRFMYRRDNTAEKCYPFWRWRVSWKQMLKQMLDLFLRANHTIHSLWANFVSTYIYLFIYIYIYIGIKKVDFKISTVIYNATETHNTQQSPCQLQEHVLLPFLYHYMVQSWYVDWKE